MRRVLFTLVAAFITLPAFASSHLVTGNGHGFVVVDPDTARITKFYAHPYSYTGPEPGKPYAEGIETVNFLDSISLNSKTQQNGISAEYMDDSHIIVTHSSVGSLIAYMPFGLNRNALMVSFMADPFADPQSKSVFNMKWAHTVASTENFDRPHAPARVIHFTDISESLLVISIDSVKLAPPNEDSILGGSFALIALEPGSDAKAAFDEFEAWRGKLSSWELVMRERNQLEEWRTKPSIHFKNDDERHLWRQSETLLRIAQSREENRPGRYNHGMIVACLPDGVFFTHWVRDMAWATLALIRMGHQAEAREAILAYFNARPTGKMRGQANNADYQISVVRYFGNGEEEPFFTMEGQPNIEFDNWGEVLWVLGEYQGKFNDPTLLNTKTYRGTVYESARDFIAKPLIKNLEPYHSENQEGLIASMDTSIWEEHQADKKHFAFSTAMAIEGLGGFVRIARVQNDNAAFTDLLDKMLHLRIGLAYAFVRDNKIHGTLEENQKNDIDGALLTILNLGISATPELMKSTADRMEELKVASGGYARVKSNYTDPAIYEYWYEREEFVFTDLALAELDWRIGRTEAGDKLLDRITQKSAADHNIIPEMYVALPCKLFPGQIGDPTGALPMVGYGAGAYILNLVERETILHNTAHIETR